MQNNSKKISREDYDLIMKESNGRGYVPENLKTNFFGVDILCGYGLYGARVRECAGEYFIDYTTGDSCD